MKQTCELLIIGAGAAGMAAAREAVSHGVDVCVIDDQPAPGGQIYRNIDRATNRQKAILGDDYRKGAPLVEQFMKNGGTYYPGASVWYLDKTKQTGILRDGKTGFIEPQFLLIATGAQERPMPVQGWDLPGVMYAGAGQILIKSSGLAPDGKLVLAGSGPLLLLLANQYLQAGVKIEAILDTTPAGRLLSSISRFGSALRAREYLLKGLGMLWNIKKAGVPYYKHVTGLRAEGASRLEAVTFQSAKKGQRQVFDVRIDADKLFLHHGVIPNLRLPLAADCEVTWSDDQQCWTVKTDQYGQIKDNIYVAGDCARIVGAMASQYQGQLSGLRIAYALEKVSEEKFQASRNQFRQLIDHHLSIRPFLDRLYMPTSEYQAPQADAAIVCRCEEVTAGQIRAAISLGCIGPNQVKSFTRCGMGPCQGGQCAGAVSRLISNALNKPMAEVGMLRVRPPLSPVTLGQIADIE